MRLHKNIGSRRNPSHKRLKAQCVVRRYALVKAKESEQGTLCRTRFCFLIIKQRKTSQSLFCGIKQSKY